MENTNIIELSVVIPTFNSANYIKQTISEIENSFERTLFAYEILIVNDGSTDLTHSVCSELKSQNQKIKILSLKKNFGQRISTNIGYKNALGKYVVTFDDDLQYKPDDILNVYNEILKGDNWIISCYYNYATNNLKYNSIRFYILYLINNLIFPNYKKTKYLSSFKIFNKESLTNFSVHNIFYFWFIPFDKIGVFKVNKVGRIFGTSNYNATNYFKMMSHILLKSVQKIVIVLAFLFFLCSYFYLNLFYVFAGLIFIALLIHLYLILDKQKFDKIKIYNRE